MIYPCHGKFVLGNSKIYQTFLYFLNTDVIQVVDIFPGLLSS